MAKTDSIKTRAIKVARFLESYAEGEYADYLSKVMKEFKLPEDIQPTPQPGNLYIYIYSTWVINM